MKLRFTRLVAFLLASTLLILWLGLGQTTHVQAISTILYVSPGGTCSGLTPCYTTVQAAVDAAVAGDEIRLAEGTYTDIHDCPRNDVVTTGVAPAVVCLSKTVTIRGSYYSNFTGYDLEHHPTYLNARGNGRAIYITGDISPTVEDLILENGNATGLGGYQYYGIYDVGGGVYIMTASATLNNNWIANNTAPKGGGGVYIGQSNSQLNYNIIENNSVTSDGAGAGVMVYKGTPTLSRNEISFNTSNEVGGGLYLFNTAAIISGNTIYSNSTTLYGGGVDVASCSPTFTGNILRSNTAYNGGGVYLWYSHSTLTNNAFIDNDATGNGNSLSIGGSTPTLYHNTFAHTTSGAGSGVFITDDGGSGTSIVTMTNTILVNQSVGILVNAGSQATVDGVLWFTNGTNTSGAGTLSVSHDFSGDPAFEPADGYHLTAASAAIDRGVNAGIPTDIDGQPRLGVPDLGADERWAPGFLKYLFLPLIMRAP